MQGNSKIVMRQSRHASSVASRKGSAYPSRSQAGSSDGGNGVILSAGGECEGTDLAAGVKSAPGREDSDVSSFEGGEEGEYEENVWQEEYKRPGGYKGEVLSTSATDIHLKSSTK